MNNDLNHTTVDIILPNYNSELYVSETINSVINQTFKNWKLIISTFAVLMLVVSCGKQTAPSISPEATKALASAKES